MCPPPTPTPRVGLIMVPYMYRPTSSICNISGQTVATFIPALSASYRALIYSPINTHTHPGDHVKRRMESVGRLAGADRWGANIPKFTVPPYQCVPPPPEYPFWGPATRPCLGPSYTDSNPAGMIDQSEFQFEWRFYALPTSKCIFRARTYQS